MAPIYAYILDSSAVREKKKEDGKHKFFSVILGQGDLEDSHCINVNEDKQALQQDSESRVPFEAD